MIKAFSQVAHIGRLNGLEHPHGSQHELKELALVFGRNASGKSTLARIIASASAGNEVEITGLRTLGSTVLPEVTLKLASGVCRFDGSHWNSNRPNALVFDRNFVEANVYVGRRHTKETRRELLRIALGPASVNHAKLVDQISSQGRELTTQAHRYEAILQTAARDHGLELAQFLELRKPTTSDLSQAELQLRTAQNAQEFLKRSLPSLLPKVPSIDFAKIRSLLTSNVKRISDAALAAVRSHLHERLGPKGEAWVRGGLDLSRNEQCPFCARSLDGVELIEQYHLYFDDKYDQFVASIDEQIRAFDSIERWWTDVQGIGRRNVDSLRQWADLLGNDATLLGSKDREAEKDGVRSVALELLSRKRANPTKALLDVTRLDWATSCWGRLTQAVSEYNKAIIGVQTRIDRRRAELSKLTVQDSQRRLANVKAAARRWEGDIVEAVSRHAQLKKKRARLEEEKRSADASMQSEGPKQLQAFATILNSILAQLSAGFQVVSLDSERTGGSSSAKLTLKFRHGTFTIDGRSDDAQLANLLSDGDRNTLALAVFLASVEDTPDLSRRIIVFDDPMTSLDADRSEATAERLSQLSRRAAQVIVLSHHGPFLAQVARNWRRHCPSEDRQCSQLILERDFPALKLWDAESEAELEYFRRWRQVVDFVERRAPDSMAGTVQADIRKLLEAAVRIGWPDLFGDARTTLEKVIRDIVSNPSVLVQTGLSQRSVEELDRLCAFGAAGNHDQSHSEIEPASPESVRVYAQRALFWIRRRDAMFEQGPKVVAS